MSSSAVFYTLLTSIVNINYYVPRALWVVLPQRYTFFVFVIEDWISTKTSMERLRFHIFKLIIPRAPSTETFWLCELLLGPWSVGRSLWCPVSSPPVPPGSWWQRQRAVSSRLCGFRLSWLLPTVICDSVDGWLRQHMVLWLGMSNLRMEGVPQCPAGRKACSWVVLS